MVFWQLTIDANDPALLARFWAQALSYQPVPPTEPTTTWHALYHALAAGRADSLNACGGDVRPGHALADAGEAGTHRSTA